jgi:glycerophosphoryl diester phosphodiesterase
VNLRRGDGRPLVVAHRGASIDQPENSLAAFEAAIALGVDLIELDVSPQLIVSHDPGGEGPALAEVLALLAANGVGAHVDLKGRGYEQAIIDEVDAHGLRGHALVSTVFADVSRRVRAFAPDIPVAIGYPQDRYGVSRFQWPTGVTALGAAALRAAVPVRIPILLTATRANVLALHHKLCSRAAVAAAHRRGAPVFAWTANDPEQISRLARLGVDAIVSDDPKTALATLNTL